MRIQHITIKNFRNVPDQDLDLNGHNVLLMADNTFGKSNFIKALHSLLNAKFGKNNIRNGEDRAEISAVLSEFDEWTPIEGTQHEFRAKIRRKGDNTEDIKIEMKYPEGGIETRVGDIRSFVGQVPLQFNFVELSRSEKGKQQQLEIVKSMWSDEDRNELRKLENRAESAYRERTEVGRDLNSAKGFITEAGISDDDLKKYAEPRDPEVMKSSKRAAEVHNKMFAWIQGEVKKWEGAHSEGAYLPCKDMLEHWIQAGKQWMSSNPFIDTAKHDAQLDEITQHNIKHERVKMLKKKVDQRNELQEQYGSLTAMIDSTREAIRQYTREHPLPVPELTIDPDNGELRFKGLLVDEEHMSTAQIMMLEVMLMMCKSNNAKVIFLERGESLGSKMLNELNEISEGYGFQIFMEKVMPGTEELIVEVQSETV